MITMELRTPGPVEPDRLQLRTRVPPEPGPGEVLLRVRTCGVCHTDLHIVQGDLPLPRLPIVPGHEIVGDVVAHGDGAARPDLPAVGQRVGVAWLGGACGHCAFCRGGRENLCPDIRFTGYHRDGGYAEYAAVRADYCYPLPERYDDVEAAPLLCAGIIGWRAIRRADVVPGDHVGLFGFGASAHLTLQVLRSWGCAVAVVTRSTQHQELARRLGADWAGGYGEAPPWPLARALVFTPAGETVTAALERLGPGGVLAIASVHLSPIPALDHDRLLYGEREIRSVTASTRQDALDFLAIAGRLPLRMETETFPLTEAATALFRLKQGSLNKAVAVLQVQR